MKKTNSIRFFSILFVICILVTARWFYPADQENPGDEKNTENKAVNQNRPTDYIKEKTSEEAVQESLKSQRSYEYVIVSEEGYLTVYESDLKTVFEYTDIEFEQLEDGIKKKVSNGYGIKNMEELYNFLENYSS